MDLATNAVGDSAAGAVFTWVFPLVLFGLVLVWLYFARLMKR